MFEDDICEGEEVSENELDDIFQMQGHREQAWVQANKPPDGKQTAQDRTTIKQKRNRPACVSNKASNETFFTSTFKRVRE